MLTEQQIETIAIAAHQANKGYCQSIGDNSQVDWADAPAWQKLSAINGVKFHLANPAAGVSASHDNWMSEKVADSWVYGDVKDPEAKTHPCSVPFDQLPQEQQTKDAIFRSVVHALWDAILNEDFAKEERAAARFDEFSEGYEEVTLEIDGVPTHFFIYDEVGAEGKQFVMLLPVTYFAGEEVDAMILEQVGDAGTNYTLRTIDDDETFRRAVEAFQAVQIEKYAEESENADIPELS